MKELFVQLVVTLIMLSIFIVFRKFFGFEYTVLFAIAFSYAGLIGRIRKI